MTLPLSGLLVVSLEQAVAAPMCTCRLADAGARVIKIERPEGDFARYYDGFAQEQIGNIQAAQYDLEQASDLAVALALLNIAQDLELAPGEHSRGRVLGQGRAA